MRKILATILMAALLPSSAFAAIAFDATGKSTSSGAHSITFPISVSGANFIVVTGYDSIGAPDATMAASSSGAAMTQVATIPSDGFSQTMTMWVYQATTSGAHIENVTINTGIASGCCGLEGAGTSYTGVLGGYTNNVQAFSSTNITSTTTNIVTTVDNSWVVEGSRWGGWVITAGTGNTTKRVEAPESSDGTAMLDSAGVIHPAGLFTATTNGAGSAKGAVILIGISPTAPPVTVVANTTQVILFGW